MDRQFPQNFWQNILGSYLPGYQQQGPGYGGPPFGGPPFGGQPGGGPPFGGPPTGGPPGQNQGASGPPTSPPPTFTPQQTTTLGSVGTYAVDPGAVRPCVRRFVYIWLENGRSFWAWLTFVGRNSAAGYRWNGWRWVYFGIDLDRIESFTCY